MKTNSMNKEQYAKYQSSVASTLIHLSFVSTGACPGCDACELSVEPSEHEIELASEPHFSWSHCESCGSALGGDRHPAHGREKDGSINHFEVCSDCLYYLNYGRLDDATMMDIENS